MSRRPARPVEVEELRGWLRAAKARRTFAAIAYRAGAQNMPVSECTLRRALDGRDGRLPTLRTVTAFARGAGVCEEEAGRMWAAAAAAVHPEPAKAADAYVPGRISTQDGLAAAMEKVRAADGGRSLRDLAASPQAAGRLSRSALHNALAGRRLPSGELLGAFAAACGAGEETARALLAARSRILAGPRTRTFYPCEIVERAEERRQREEAVRLWLVPRRKPEPELDGYDQQLRDEKEITYRRRTAWADSISDDELQDLEDQAQAAAGTAGDLRGELAAYVTRAGAGGGAGRIADGGAARAGVPAPSMPSLT